MPTWNVDPIANHSTVGTANGQRRFALQVALPIASLMIAAAALVFGVLWWTADERDRHAIAASGQVVLGVIASRGEFLADQAMDYVVWDDAFEHLHVAPDPDWADRNIGSWLFGSAGIDVALVVAPGGRVTYASRDGQRSTANTGAEVLQALRALVDRLRANPSGQALTALVRLDGGAAIAGGAAIRREGTKANNTIASLLILVDRLDQPFLSRAGRNFGLVDLHWRGDGDHPMPGRLMLRDDQGQDLGVLAWQLDLPGAAMLRKVVPTFAAVMIALAAITILVLRNARRTLRLLRAAEARSTLDPLTGLPNRVLLADRIGYAFASCRRDHGQAAMLYLDLDGFKAVNDSIGHPQGDKLLIEVARRLRTAIRETDTVARLGGDEFAIVQTSVEQPAAAVALCRRLLQFLAEPYDLDGQQLRLGVSIGVAMIPADGANDVEILRAADHALYRAKAAGRGTFRLAGHDSELTPPAASSNGSLLDERASSAHRGTSP